MTRSRAYLPLSQNFGDHSVGFSRSTYAHFPIVKGLVSYWPFVEGAGAVVSDYWGTNNGTLNHTVDWCRGRWGNAYDFDGADDFVDLDAHALTFAGYSVGTLSVWFNSAYAGTDPKCIFSMWGDPAETDDWVMLGTGNWTGDYADESLMWSTRSGAVTHIEGYIRHGHAYYHDQQWHNFAFVMGTNFNRFYVNGKQESVTYHDGSAATGGRFLNIANAQHMEVGRRPFGGGSLYWQGIIDELCIWNRALKRSEIVSMMWRRREG